MRLRTAHQLHRSSRTAETAEACALLDDDLGWRAAVVDAGRARVKAFDPDAVAARTKDALGL